MDGGFEFQMPCLLTQTLCHLSYVHFGIKYPFSSPYDNVSLLN